MLLRSARGHERRLEKSGGVVKSAGFFLALFPVQIDNILHT